MSVPALLVTAILTLWMLASLCYAFRVPRVHEALKRLNWFRSFAHWTMFAASPNPRIRPGVFVVEFRDEPGNPWRIALDGHHWTAHSFLLSPRRFIAARAHHLGQIFAELQREAPHRDVTNERRHREEIIGAYLLRTHPLAAGKTRAVRIVKRFGRTAAGEEEIAWQFTVRGS